MSDQLPQDHSAEEALLDEKIRHVFGNLAIDKEAVTCQSTPKTGSPSICGRDGF